MITHRCREKHQNKFFIKITLTENDLTAIKESVSKIEAKGERYGEASQKMIDR